VIDLEGIGALFDGDEPAVLAAALRSALDLARDPETAARCRARALELSASRCAAEYLRLYAQVRERPS